MQAVPGAPPVPGAKQVGRVKVFLGFENETTWDPFQMTPITGGITEFSEPIVSGFPPLMGVPGVPGMRPPVVPGMVPPLPPIPGQAVNLTQQQAMELGS